MSADHLLDDLARAMASRLEDRPRLVSNGGGLVVLAPPAVSVVSPVEEVPAGEVLAPGALNLPVEFYEARPILAHVRQAAHSRLVPADTVLAVVLAHVAALTPPSFMLPPTIGSPASLNFYAALIGAPNTGKSAGKRVACELVPTTEPTVADDVPLGSGEGLVDCYFDMIDEDNGKGGTKRVKRQTRTAAFIYLDEGQALGELGKRKGSTLMPTLRSGWTGDTLGQANASVETKRRLAAQSYRLAVVVGFQPSTAADLLSNGEVAAGTPQRFVWAWTRDRSIPDNPPAWPGPLPWVPPVPHGYGDLAFDDTLTLAASITVTIREAALARNRGESTIDAIEGHAELGRLKVAGLLAILEGRTDVTADDWDLAGVYMATSIAVRTAVIGSVERDARQREEASVARAVRRELTIDDSRERRAVESMAKAIGRKVHKVGPSSVRDINRATASKHREVASLEDAIALAVDKGWIVRTEDLFTPGESRPS